MSINQDTILYIMTTLVLFFFRDMDVHSLLPLSFSYIPTSLFKENTLIGLGLSLLAVARAIWVVWSYRTQYWLFHVQPFPWGQLSPETFLNCEWFSPYAGLGYHLHILTKWFTILTTSGMLSPLMVMSRLKNPDVLGMMVD